MKHTINSHLNPLFEITEQWFSASLNEFSERLTENLIAKAEQSRSVTVQSDCFTALHSINKTSHEAIPAFITSLAKRFQLQDSGQKSNSRLDTNKNELQLNLMATKELEENLSFDNAVEKITKQNKEAFEHLEIRIIDLLKRQGEYISKSPLSADNIISAFRESIELFDFSPEIRFHTYRLFENFIAGDISELLKKLNDELIKKGILPEITTDYSIKKQTKKPQNTERLKPADQIVNEQELSAQEFYGQAPDETSHYQPEQSDLNISLNTPDSMQGMKSPHFNSVSQTQQNNVSSGNRTAPSRKGNEAASNLSNRYIDLANQLSKPKMSQPRVEAPPKEQAPNNVQLNKLLGHTSRPSENINTVSAGNNFSSLKQIYADNHQKLLTQEETIFVHEHNTSTEELIDALIDIQYIASLDSNSKNTPIVSINKQIKDNILASTDKSSEKTQLRNNKLYLIDMIEDLFTHIVNNKKLSLSAQELLRSLMLPVIHLALIDETFLENRKHVARLFLDDFADAAMGLTDSESNLNNPIYLKLKKISTKFTHENKVNSSVFSEHHNDLKRFINHRKQLANSNGKSSKASITKKIDAILKHCLQNKNTPKGITLILNKIWKNVMLNIYLDNTCDDDHRERAAAFINSLIFSIKPAQSSIEKKRLETLIPIINNELNSGLSRVNCPKHVKEKVISYLEKLHHKALDAYQAANLKTEEIIYKNELFDDSKLKDKTIRIESESMTDDLILFDESINTEPSTKIISSLEDAFINDNNSQNNASEPAPKTDAAYTTDNQQKAHFPEKQSRTDFELIRLANHSYKMLLIDDEYTNIAKNIVEDLWLEFHFKTHFSRVRVTWIEDDHSQFNCLTQNNRVVEMSLEALSDSLRQGICAIIQSSSIIDEAIKSTSLAAEKKH